MHYFGRFFWQLVGDGELKGRGEKSKGDWRHGDLQENPRYLENRDKIQLD